MERKGRDKKRTEKVFKMDVWGRGKDTGVFSKGRNAKGMMRSRAGRRAFWEMGF